MIKILIADDHAVVRQGVVAERKDGQHPRARILQKMSLQTNMARDRAVLHLPALGNVWRRRRLK